MSKHGSNSSSTEVVVVVVVVLSVVVVVRSSSSSSMAVPVNTRLQKQIRISYLNLHRYKSSIVITASLIFSCSHNIGRHI
jgi:hypothetical protein